MPTTYADANDFKMYWGVDIEERYEAEVNKLLTFAASNIQMALQSAGALGCSMDDAAITYLKNLNVILGAVLYYAPCWPSLNTEQKRLYMEFANTQLDLIRDGSIELCAGETGKDFASIDWAEQSVDEFSAAKIIARDL